MIPSHSFPASTTQVRQRQNLIPRRRLLAASGAAALAPALAACSSGESAAVRAGMDQATGLTSFSTFGRDAYWYVTPAKGFFGDRRLDVQVESGFGAQNLTQLSGGTAQFGAVDLSSLIINIAQAQGDSGFRAVAAIHQLAPSALMTADPDIRTPADLAGKTVAMAAGSVLELLFPAFATLAGLDPADVRIVNADPPTLPSLLAEDKVDAIEQFAMGQPTVETAAERPVTVLPYSEYLTDLYGVVLVTTTELIENNPDLVRRFRDALLRGLDYSLDHPDEAGQILADAVDTADADVAAAELEIMDAYSRVPGTPTGGLDEVRVAKSIALLEGTGAIPAGMVASDIVDFDLAPG